MTEPQPAIANDWYQQSFDALYSIVYAHRTVEAAREEALFSIRQVNISKSDTVLDLCCGNGRHMAHLKHTARRVVGLDFSPYLLSLASQLLGDGVLLVRGDMRKLPFTGVFDVVCNYFTSFGYFAAREENLEVVKSIVRALKPGGRFFIDYINHNWALQHVEPSSVRNQNGYLIQEDRWIDGNGRRLNKSTVISRDGKKVNEFGESVQLYTLAEMTGLLEEGGIQVERTYGDYSGTDCCDPSKPRMIIIGRKF